MNDSKKSTLFFILATALLLALTACRKNGEMPIEEVDTENDTTTSIVENDSIIDEVEVIPAKQADELFDDFVFAFMKNQYFQKQRIQFPLTYTCNGEKTKIAKKDWNFDRMYSQYEIYTLIFDNVKAESAAKDTTLRHVVVEELDLENRRTKNYDFKRLNGEWQLTALAETPVAESRNSDFYEFYHRFASDADFQMKHIQSPLQFSTFDDDTFENVEGVIEPEQFSEFAPVLPTTKITNILYSQSTKESNVRILSLRALAGGMECTMTFKRIDGEWTLTRMDN